MDRISRAAVLAALLCAQLAAAESGQASPKVLFVGVDGASWKVIGPLLAAGELPTFASFVRDGAHTPAFETMGGGASPLIWTTIATGRSPEDHGITAFVTELKNGTRVPVTSSSRTARAIWEVASEHGKSVGVIGYWASWPAEEVDGYVITDHANSAFSEFMFEDGRLWTGAAPERLSRLQRDFFPLDVGPILAEHWITREEFPFADMQRRGGFTDVQIELLRGAPWNVFDDYYSLLKTMYRVDYPLARVAGKLMAERPTDLVILYLRGPDPIQHMAWDLVEPQAYAVPNPNLERDRGMVQSVYRAVDSMLAELVARAGPDAWVIVASDHGIEPSPAATGDPRQGRPGEHPETAKGVLFLRGPHVKPGYRIGQATPYDLMPTFAWLLGLPLSEELGGRILSEAFEESFAAGRAVHRIASYGPRQTSAPERSPADQLMLDLLKGLGYIGN
ncbi:MAG: alkaline phosphatase family protein [Thermoanaerobaculia bacterium]